MTELIIDWSFYSMWLFNVLMLFFDMKLNDLWHLSGICSFLAIASGFIMLAAVLKDKKEGK